MSKLNPKFQTTTKIQKSCSPKLSESELQGKVDEAKRIMLYHLHSLVIEDHANSQTKFKVTDENKQILTDLKMYLAKQPGNLDTRKGIIFMGSVGSGKSMILEMIRRCMADLWHKELSIYTAPYIKDQYYKESETETISWIVQNYRFLGINDIGLELATKGGDELLRNVLYERFEKRLFTFITTNLTLSQFYKRYEYPDNVGRMGDRFQHMFNYVKLSGASFR
jgi:DNA replication protein DnaC